MGEADAVALRRQETCLFRLDERRARIDLVAQCVLNGRQRRLRERRDRQCDAMRSVRGDRHASGYQVLDASRDRQRSVGGTSRASRATARAISSAKNGLPPEASASRTSLGRDNESPRRSSDHVMQRSQRERSQARRVPDDPRVTRAPRPSGGSSPPSVRRATTRPSPSGRRRAAKASASSDAASSHWTSSIATRTGTASGERREGAGERGRRRAGVEALVRLRQQQRSRERPPLRGRQLRRDVFERRPDEIRTRRTRSSPRSRRDATAAREYRPAAPSEPSRPRASSCRSPLRRRSRAQLSSRASDREGV